ncbi:MAG TPA: hypothetical protein VGH74_09635, partial [Planctomycetaceae bacterium]
MNRPPRKNGPPGGKPGRKPDPDDDDPEVSEKSDATRLKLRRLDGNRFSLTPPVCAFDRQEDLEEVRQMIAAGELEIARDELLYLVSDCRGFLEAHNLL